MIFEQIKIGGDRNFAYLIGDDSTREGAVVDPGYNQDVVFDRIDALKLKILYTINTHSHHDHVGGNTVMKERLGAQLVAHRSVGEGAADILVDDGSSLALGDIRITFLHTPGHSGDSICILAGQKVITGDTLFVGKIGGANGHAAAELQYRSLHDKLMTLADDIEVYPGHDVGVTPSSTIGQERRTNPFITQPTLQDFIYLKEHWAEYKAKHGIK